MAEQPGGKDDAGGGSKPQTLMERLERSVSTLYQLAEEVAPGVCLMSDAPQQSLRQAARFGNTMRPTSSRSWPVRTASSI